MRAIRRNAFWKSGLQTRPSVLISETVNIEYIYRHFASSATLVLNERAVYKTDQVVIALTVDTRHHCNEEDIFYAPLSNDMSDASVKSKSASIWFLMIAAAFLAC